MSHISRLTYFFRNGGKNFEIQKHIYMKMGCKIMCCFCFFLNTRQDFWSKPMEKEWKGKRSTFRNGTNALKFGRIRINRKCKVSC